MVAAGSLLSLLAAPDLGREGDGLPIVTLVECGAGLGFETIPWSEASEQQPIFTGRGRMIGFKWNPDTGELSFDRDAPAFTLPDGVASVASAGKILRCE
jgi:hypothetical protein